MIDDPWSEAGGAVGNEVVAQYVEPELKPCPFCGSDMHEACYSDYYQIACHKCKSSTGLYLSMKEAEQAWNGRT